jgi:hypothetical protein
MNCDCFPLRWDQPLAPGGSDQYAVDFAPRLARVLGRRTSYDLGVRLRSSKVAGFEWEVTHAGQTGDLEPRLPTKEGLTVQDGSCILTCRAIGSGSLEAQLTNVTWTPPSGLTISGDTWGTDQKAVATITAGANLAYGEYTIKVTATAGGKVIVQDCILKVGNC